MDTAAKKWKDYKADLKDKYFDEILTDEQMKERLKNILNDEDLNNLIMFWRSPECQARTERGKANRAKLRVHHTSGSISHACRSYNLGKALGRRPRRDEVYINTHTRRNGVPLREAAGTIDELKAIVEAQPELKDKTIQEGDAYAAVCGAKEPRGRVRVLGLGPTPKRLVPLGSKHSCQQECKWKLLLDRMLKVRTELLSNVFWNWKRKGWHKEGQMLKSYHSMVLIQDNMRF